MKVMELLSGKIDTLPLSAKSLSELYRKLNTLREHGKGGWEVLRCPWWRNGTLNCIVIRWSK